MTTKLHTFDYDPFQINSIEAINRGENVLATAHTGCGKTAIAEHAIWCTLNRGKKVIFTSPIKALSNEKFFDFSQKLEVYGIELHELGLVTGDIKVNPEGRLVIMTAEILNNMSIDELANVELVVMDEVHWFNDPERGRVWENTLMCLPKIVQVVLLSATIAQPEKFASWIERVRQRKTQTIATNYRVVPLKHFILQDSEIIPTYSDGEFNYLNFRKLEKSKYSVAHRLNKSIELLLEKNKAPAIFFCMSRKNCEKFAHQVQKTCNDHTDRASIDTHCFNLLKKFPEVRELPAFIKLKSCFDKGIAYHHSGMIPILKELVEILYKASLIKILFATETLAVGVNMPTRSVVFTQLDKWNGKNMRSLTPAEFRQMMGRAGRRGHDTIGFVFYLPLTQNIFTAKEYHNLLTQPVEPVRSQLKIDMIFVLGNLQNPTAMEKSMSFSQNQDYLAYLKTELLEAKKITFEANPELAEYIAFKEKMTPGGFVHIRPNKLKKMKKQLEKIKATIDDFDTKMQKEQKYLDHMQKCQSLEKQIKRCSKQYQQNWNYCLEDLQKYGFAENETTPTKLGKVALCFPDAMPLEMGTCVYQKAFTKLNFTEICMFLSLFVNGCCKAESTTWKRIDCSPELESIFELLQECNPEYQFNWDMVFYIQKWCQDKNFIALDIEPSRQGDFVKAILRMCNFVDQVKKASEIMEDYTTINKLDDHQEKLMGGVVSNESLYLMRK